MMRESGTSALADQTSDPAAGAGEVPVRLADVNVEFPVSGGEAGETFFAVNGVSLAIRRGEILVLVGKSGCGKTTVLNVVAGLVKATGGVVEVMGKSPVEGRQHVAYMFARDALLPWRTAARNIEFALELRRPEIGRRERHEKARELLEMLGVGRAAKLFPWQLSQGMRQRVALARTWAIEPDVLLMDEPFAALDAQTRIEAQQMFLDTWSRNRKTAMFVTHDLDEAILLGDRVIVMHSGKAVDEVRIDTPRPRDPLRITEEPSYRGLHHRLVTALTTGVAAPAPDEGRG
jgi:NitT/TauT family transport system ATP-binding protein